MGYVHSDNIIEEFKKETLEVYNNKPVRKIVLLLDLFENGTYVIGTKLQDLESGSNFTKDILPVIMYEKSLFLEYLKKIDKK